MNHLFKKLLLITLINGTLFTLTGCEEEESNDLAKAQDCLDKITSNYNDASNCLSYVAKYDSQQANILKCSIHMVNGGLTTARVGQAYKNLSVNTYTNKEAAFISVLALKSGKAAEAQPFCLKSELKGLIYISNLAVMASTMADTLGGVGYDPLNDPTDIPTDSQVTAMITNCQPGGTTGANSCNHTAIGNAVISIGSSYCATASTTDEVCSQINSAINTSGGDAALVAKKLFCTLNNQTYTSTPSEDCI